MWVGGKKMDSSGREAQQFVENLVSGLLSDQARMVDSHERLARQQKVERAIDTMTRELTAYAIAFRSDPEALRIVVEHIPQPYRDEIAAKALVKLSGHHDQLVGAINALEPFIDNSGTLSA